MEFFNEMKTDTQVYTAEQKFIDLIDIIAVSIVWKRERERVMAYG